jgi:hypothetical protein
MGGSRESRCPVIIGLRDRQNPRICYNPYIHGVQERKRLAKIVFLMPMQKTKPEIHHLRSVGFKTTLGGDCLLSLPVAQESTSMNLGMEAAM